MPGYSTILNTISMEMKNHPYNLTIALVGCGKWGKHILRDLKALGCRVPVVARSPESVARAQEGGAHQIYTTISELLIHEDINGAVVASTTSSHYEVIDQIASLNNTIPIFVEKPVAPSAKQAWSLHKMYPNRIFVMDKWRYHPGVLALAEIVQSQELGRLCGIRTERLGWGMPHEDLNAVWHLFPHDLAILYELLGTVPNLTSAQIQRSYGHVTGCLATLGNDPWISCAISAHSPERRRRIQVICEDGVAVLDDGYSTAIQIVKGPLFNGDIKPNSIDRPLSSEMPLLAELKAFVNYVRGDETPPKTPLLESIRVVELIEETLSQ